MGATEIVIIIAAAAVVVGVAISSIVAKKRGKKGCCGCAGCPHAGKCSAAKHGHDKANRAESVPAETQNNR